MTGDLGAPDRGQAKRRIRHGVTETLADRHQRHDMILNIEAMGM